MMTERTTIPVVAGENSRGEFVREEVLVDRVGETVFRVVATPGLVLGIARGDLVNWSGGDSKPEVLDRGGFVALQIHGNHEVADLMAEEVARLGGYLDGRAARLTVYSIPVKVGFPQIEGLAKSLCERYPGTEWYYGNVYDDADGITPLNWW